MITSILIFAAILITAGPAVAVGSSDDGDDDKPEETQYVDDPESPFYREDGHPEEPDLRPATNPHFDPDESCDLVWELKCIPGTEQGCPEGYNNFEVDVCTPIGCPEGYHDYHEDEDAKCYSNDQECKYDLVLVKNEEYGDSCEPPEE